MPNWEFESPEKTYSHSWEIDPTTRDKILRFEIRKDEGWTNKTKKSFRSEVSTDFFPNLNKTCDYSFELKLPFDFPIEDNRLVLAQWWAKTKKDLGEMARSPAVALRFSKGKLYVTVRHSNERVVTNPDAVPEEQIFKKYDFKLGEWNKFDFRIFWSFKDEGLINLKLNGELVAKYSGPIGYNDDLGPVFRFGIYRDDSPNTYIANFRNVRFSCD